MYDSASEVKSGISIPTFTRKINSASLLILPVWVLNSCNDLRITIMYMAMYMPAVKMPVCTPIIINWFSPPTLYPENPETRPALPSPIPNGFLIIDSKPLAHSIKCPTLDALVKVMELIIKSTKSLLKEMSSNTPPAASAAV